MDGEEHSAQSVEIPGMDKAVFINLGMNTRLIAIYIGFVGDSIPLFVVPFFSLMSRETYANLV